VLRRVIHGLRGLSKDEAGQVNAALSALDARRDLRADLVAALERELPPEIQSVADCVECANVSVSIRRFSPEQHGRKQLSLHLRTEMRIEWRTSARARSLRVASGTTVNRSSAMSTSGWPRGHGF